MAKRTSTLRRQFYQSVGRFTLTWASMENGLDILAVTSTSLGSPERAKTPHQLADKVEFVRKHLLPKLPPDHSFKLGLILKKIDELAVNRHDVIHGAGMAEERDGEAFVVSLWRLLQPRNKPRRKMVKITSDQIDKMTEDVFDIWGELLDFAEKEIRGKLH
jgi:hypothetical protein